MTSDVFDKELLLTYLRLAEIERMLTDQDKKILGNSFYDMKDSIRNKIDPTLLDDIDASYASTLMGGIPEHEVERLTPEDDLSLPVRAYLSDETYELLLDYLSSQLLYISVETKRELIPMLNSYPVEKWSNTRYYGILEKLKLAFEKDGVSFLVFKHNESLGDNDEYENKIRELLNVYFPMSMKKTLG